MHSAAPKRLEKMKRMKVLIKITIWEHRHAHLVGAKEENFGKI